MEERNGLQKFFYRFRFPIYLLLIMWVIQVFQYFTGTNLGFLGIFPKKLYGLKGILFAPLIHDHADFQHIIANSPPFFFLTTMLLFFYRKVAYRSFAMIYILTGLAVWLFGRSHVYHIGASGVVYGLVAFVFWSGIFRRSLQSIVLALIVTFLYSGYFMGILPNQEGVSWESHLLGGLIGIFTAYWYKSEIEQSEEPKKPSWEIEGEQQKEFFLPRDAFEKTRAERQREQEEKNNGGWFSNIS